MALHIERCCYCGCDDIMPYLKVSDHSVSKEVFNLVECFCCGLIHTSPQPDIQEIGPYYKSEEYISHTDSNKGFINSLYHIARNWTLGRKYALIKTFHKNGTLLDIGCGTGYFASFMQQKGYTLSAMEPDSEVRKKAEEKTGIQIFPTLPEVTGTYDIITMWHVLEHVHNLEATFVKLESLLSESGVLFIAVPNPQSPDAQLYKEHWAAYDVPRHIYHFKKSVIKQLANRYKMKVTGIRQMKLDSYYISMLSEKYKNGSILKAAWNGFLSNLKSGKDNSSSLIYIIQKQK